MMDADTLTAQIDATLSAFEAARAELEQDLAGYFEAAKDVADTLLTHADEFGPRHAVEALCAAPEQFGDRVPEPRGALADRADDLAERLDILIDSHDSLDKLTQQRTAALGRQQGPGRHLHIQGKLFSIGIDTRGLVRAEPVRENDRQPERDDVPLAARLIDELGVARAEPRSGQDRDRKPGRSR